jgi:hypothetical protein
MLEEPIMKKSIFAFAVAFAAFLPLLAQDVSLTVYNQNRALVRDVRSLDLSTGIGTVSITDVAATIDPTSVHIKSVTAPDKLNVLEQNYEYDLVGSQKILEKYVDQDIRLVTDKGEIMSGMLLSASGEDVVIQNEKGGIRIIKGKAIQSFDFSKLPEGLITRPTLVWQVDNAGPKKQDVEVSYLTFGVNWHAEYVAVTDAQDKQLDLSGWVSIENNSGATYKNAKLKLVAGDVNVIQERRVSGFAEDRAVLKAAAEPQFEEKSFFEYHLYTLQHRTTVKNNETKQIALFPPSQTPAQKLFLYDGAAYGDKVRVHLEFKNGKKEGLGMPLPKGKVRVYKQDTDGSLEFIGEDMIDHTPADEKVRLFLGNAFDLVGERVQKATRKISNRSREEDYEIRLRNHKKEAVEITVSERFWGDWKITSQSIQSVKKDSRTAEFKIPVKPDGEAMLTYTVLLSW